MPAAVHGLILFAHGARDPRWALPFEAIAQRVRAQAPALQVQLAYLEFMAPSLPDAGELLANQGCTEVAVLPLFLGAGGHVRRDLPLLVQSLREQHPAVAWTLHEAAGEHPAITEALALHALSLMPASATHRSR
jgi:sirohydrochlorin cobaltochelatase